MHPQTSSPHHRRSDALALPATEAEMTRELLERHGTRGGLYRAAFLVLGGLFLLGIVGAVLRIAGGFDDPKRWGYFAAVTVYLWGVAGAAPIVSIGLRMTKNHWRRPLSRVAELYAVVGVLAFLLFLPLMALLPSANGRISIWMEWPWAPHVWGLIALGGVAVGGLAVLFIAARPDLAALRDRGRGGLATRLSAGWQGTKRQWGAHRAALGVAGGFYFMFFVATNIIVGGDFAMSLVPGWKDAIFPAYLAVTSLQAGTAAVVVTLYVMRRWGGYKDYIALDQFWSISKILLALTLLWFYFWWSAFVTFWYGRAPTEQNLLQLFMVGPYRPLFVTAFLMSFLVPFLLLIWNPVRKSILGPTVVSVIILVGTFVDRLRLFVPAFSVSDFQGHALEQVPPLRAPDGADWLVMVGLPAGAIFVYLLGTRLVPAMSLWEMKELVYLRVVRPFHKTWVTVLGKPD